MSEEIPQYNQRIGWREQASVDIDPITSIDPVFYEFGEYTTSWGKFPMLESEVDQFYRGTSFNPYHTKISSTRVTGGVSFIPVNGLAFYLMMARNASGVVYDSGTGRFRVKGITSGLVNEYVVRYRSDNDTDRIQRTCIGTKFASLTVSLDWENKTLPLASSIQFMAKEMFVINTGSGAAVPTQPANTNWFLIDDSTELMWDVDLHADGYYVSGGTDLDLTPYVMAFTTSIDVNLVTRKIITKHQVKTISNGDRTFAWTMKIRRNDETSIFDHYVGTTVDGTVANDDSQAGVSYALGSAFKNIHFKVFALDSADATGNNYFQVDLKNCSIDTIELNNADPESNEEPFYQIKGLADQTSGEFVDEVSPTLYGTS